MHYYKNFLIAAMCAIVLSISTTEAAVLEGGRACIVPLHDCPDGETCIIQEGDYGHCG